MTNKTIYSIVKNGLCTGCGTCISLCPNEAIKLGMDEKNGIYIPELNESKCNKCGLCYKVCPGYEVDFKALNIGIFGKEPENILIGNFLNCYVGYSSNINIRHNAASGGLITSLLIFALEEGLINGALVTRMKKNKPLEPEPFIARTPEEITEACGSKYCPVPANIGLKEIIMAKENERFAVVGLPCHIHGLRKAQIVNAKLRERVVLSLGIICNHTPTFKATEYLLTNVGVKNEDVIMLNYRGQGWPGGLKIESKKGKTVSKIVHEYWASGFGTYFYSDRCTVCCDQTCELADISFADAWLPELANDSLGTSIFVNRTNISEILLRNMQLKEKVEFERIDYRKLIQTQKGALLDRKKLRNRIFIFKFLGKGTPKYNVQLLEPNGMDYLKSMILYLQMHISKKQYLWGLIRIEGNIKVCLMRYIKNHNNILKLVRKIR